jgi:hypothetical protein
MGFGEQMFTKASQNSDISASCSENIVTVAFYVNVKSCRYFINRLALHVRKVLDQHTTYRGTAIPFLVRVDCKIKISNANFTSEIRKTIVLGIF